MAILENVKSHEIYTYININSPYGAYIILPKLSNIYFLLKRNLNDYVHQSAMLTLVEHLKKKGIMLHSSPFRK